MELNVANFIAKLQMILGFTGKGSVGKMAMKVGILPATIYNLASKGKDFSVTTLIRLKQGSGLDWETIGKMLEEEFKE